MLYIPFAILFLFIFVFKFLLPTPVSAYGHHLALFSTGFVLILVRPKIGKSLHFVVHSFLKNVQSVFPAMLILALVGILIAFWAKSGVLFHLILLGESLISPKFLLPGFAIVNGIASIASGSSWTTAGTVGLAMMGLGSLYGIPPEISAGAIISGCYFGDKLSPLSDTTILASSLTSVPIQEHIRFMLRTTVPSFVLSLFLFWIANGYLSPAISIEATKWSISSHSLDTPISYLHLIPVLLVFLGSILSLPSFVSLSLGILASLCFLEFPLDQIGSLGHTLLFGYQANTGNERMDIFLSGGGLIAVLPTEILILTAVWFGGSLEGLGYLKSIIQSWKQWIHKKEELLLTAMSSSFILNLSTADQYLSIVIPARSFSQFAVEYKVKPKEIARALEDSGTLSSPLVPWNSCGAFMAGSLHVATISYLPFVWFNLIHISITVIRLLVQRKIK
ncbi:Na+/H+ antiporter NhaC family protein [Leptospira ryugenii]|nr:Na+/H+ antiporter NhaC family protein [Leptospira ryugenii]